MNMLSPGGFRVLPPVVKNLLIINAIFFLATVTLPNTFNIDLYEIFSLKYFGSEHFRPYQLITYMFMHGNFGHIFFNMFALWMFGSTIENFWGPRRFLIYYLVTGIGAGLVHYLVYYFQINPLINTLDTFLFNPNMANLNEILSTHRFKVDPYYDAEIYNAFLSFQRAVGELNISPNNSLAMHDAALFISDYREYYLNMPSVVGASGAVFGILLAFGMMFPNVMIYLYFFIPIRAKWFVIFYGALELYLGVAGTQDGIAHFAHLGGMLFGIVLILLWRRNSRRNFFK